jgi:hypothetical protein
VHASILLSLQGDLVQLKEIPVQGTFELKNKAMDVLVTVSRYTRTVYVYCTSLVLSSVFHYVNNGQIVRWEANTLSASRNIRLLRISKSHYDVIKRWQLDPILNHMNAVHSLAPKIFKTNFDKMLLSELISSKWFLPFLSSFWGGGGAPLIVAVYLDCKKV